MISVTGFRGISGQIVASVMLVTTILGFMAPHVSADCALQDTSRGMVTATITIPQDGIYRVWTRLKANAANNSAIVEVDATSCGVVVGDDDKTTNNDWQWIDYQAGLPSSKIDLKLNAGSHTLKIIGREDNVVVDRIIFTTDTACQPSGFGDNCAGTTAASVTVVNESSGSSSHQITAQSRGGNPLQVSSSKSANALVAVPNNGKVVVAGMVTLQPIASDANQVIRVEYYIDGKKVATKETPPFSYTLSSKTYSDGSHTVVSKTYYADGTMATSKQFLDVQNDAFRQVASTTATSGLLAVVVAGLLYTMRRRKFLIPHTAESAASAAPSGERDKHVNVAFKTIIKPAEKHEAHDE
jgi:hypothetical protein